jgi:hypothetical protein
LVYDEGTESADIATNENISAEVLRKRSGLTRGLPIGKACDLKSKRDNSNFSKGRILIMKLALHVHLLLLLSERLLKVALHTIKQTNYINITNADFD